MLTHPTIEKLQALHLTAMATAFDQQRSSSAHAELPFEDRFGLLVDTGMSRYKGSPRYLSLHIANRAQTPTAVELYRPRILRSLSRCGWFIVYVSRAAVASNWVRFEVYWALSNRPLNRIMCLAGRRGPHGLEPRSSGREVDSRPPLASSRPLCALMVVAQETGSGHAIWLRRKTPQILAIFHSMTDAAITDGHGNEAPDHIHD